MKFAEAVVKILELEGITDAFGIPGAGINSIYKFLGDSDRITHYTVRHEEAAAHAAGAYFRASGKMAVCMTTSGPGATNLVTGLYTNQIDSIPLIAITGQAVTSQLGKDAFQCVDIALICKSVCKATWCITDASKGVETLRAAFRIAREGKPGPVLLDIPLDVQMTEVDFDPATYTPESFGIPAADVSDIRKALEMIRAAASPVLIMGGGVVLAEACELCVAFAELAGLPVITTYMAKGCIPENHPLNAGHMGIQVGQPIGNRVFLDSDLVIGIGNRFTDRHTGAIGVYRGERKFIHINIEAGELNKIFPADLAIRSDAKAALRMLIDEAKAMPAFQAAPRVAQLPALKRDLRRKTDYDRTPIMPQRAFDEMNKAFGDNVIYTTGCGITQIWSGQFQEVNQARHYLPSGGAGTLGYDIPAAFGAMVATGCKTKAVAVMGDFGFTFHVQELAVAAKFQVPLIVVIINNAYLGLIRQNQKYAFGYEYAVEMGENQRDMDYVKVAEGFACAGERVFAPGDLAGAFARALASKVPYVVDIVCDQNADCSMGGDIQSVREFQ